MSTLFGNATSEGLEAAKDTLGGFRPRESDIYDFLIKNLYVTKSSGGATAVNLIAEEGGREYRETFWVLNKDGKNYYMAKKDGKETGAKAPLMGFTMVNDICLIATGKPLSEQDTEDKVVEVYEDGQRVKKAVPALIECIGQRVALGVLKKLVNKTEKDNNGNYVPTAEEREENETNKVFHPEYKLTVVEANAEATEPTFWNAWLELNKGKTQDRRTFKAGQGGAAGAPQAARAAAPAAGEAAAAPKKTLFGNKK